MVIIITCPPGSLLELLYELLQFPRCDKTIPYFSLDHTFKVIYFPIFIRDFIIEHGNDSTARLLLSREKWPDIDISLAVNTIESRRKLKDKLPAWYGCPDLIYPNTISAEQCSSAETAALKASIAASLVQDRAARIADLTGGLGADSCAFRDAGFEVLYISLIYRLGKMGIRTGVFKQGLKKLDLNTEIEYYHKRS